MVSYLFVALVVKRCEDQRVDRRRSRFQMVLIDCSAETEKVSGDCSEMEEQDFTQIIVVKKVRTDDPKVNQVFRIENPLPQL